MKKPSWQFKDMQRHQKQMNRLESLDMNNRHLQVAMSPVKSSEEENGVTVLIRDVQMNIIQKNAH